MSESDLLKRIFELETQNLALLAENKQLREKFGFPVEKYVAKISSNDTVEIESIELTNDPPINKYSSPNDKIELFMSLFRGRTDVYAKRCFSKKYGNSYYVPACRNEWIRDVCYKTRTKCKNCAKRELLPMTEDVIDSHLRNKDENGSGIVTICPPKPYNTTTNKIDTLFILNPLCNPSSRKKVYINGIHFLKL